MSTDYLDGTEYLFSQDDAFLKITKDNYIIGTFIEPCNGKTVLDIGTNTGSLLLYALSKGAEKLIGVDIHEDALKVAKRNLERYTDNFELICSPIQDVDIDPVDVIVCNPPFFDGKCTKKEQEYLNDAMFDDTLPMDDLFKSIRRLLKENGFCYLIYQSERIAELMRSIDANKLKIVKMQFVADDNKKDCHRVLFKLKRGKTTKVKVEREIVIKH